MQIEFETDVFRWESRADLWCFGAVPVDLSDLIRELPLAPRGFGSVPVEVRIEHVSWRTSVFPNSDGRFVFALKKSVRDALGIGLGDTVTVELATIGV